MLRSTETRRHPNQGAARPARLAARLAAAAAATRGQAATVAPHPTGQAGR